MAKEVLVADEDLYGRRQCDSRGADSNELRNNTVTSNVERGIFVTGSSLQSQNNSIIDNELSDNIIYDLQDLTSGTGTALTANFYEDNQATSCDPSGLCS